MRCLYVTRKTRCVFLHSLKKVDIVNDDVGLRSGGVVVRLDLCVRNAIDRKTEKGESVRLIPFNADVHDGTNREYEISSDSLLVDPMCMLYDKLKDGNCVVKPFLVSAITSKLIVQFSLSVFIGFHPAKYGKLFR